MSHRRPEPVAVARPVGTLRRSTPEEIIERFPLRSLLSVLAVLAVITLAGYLLFGSMVGGG